MQTSTQTSGFGGDAAFGRIGHGSNDALDLEKALICAACELKHAVSSRLLGEISDEQFEAQRACLVERYRCLTEASCEAGWGPNPSSVWQ